MSPPAGAPWPTGEHELRARLHEELSAFRPPPVPVDAVLLRGQAARGRRRLMAVAGLTVLAGIAALLVVTVPGTRPGQSGPVITTRAPDPRAPGGVFASGTAAGRAWRLAVRDIADPGAACLPAVLLDGGDGDLLARPGPGPGPVIGNVAFLARDPAQPAAGFAFVQVQSGVTRVLVQLRRRATSLVIQPVTVTRCGEHFRLAGFAFPALGVRRVTAVLPDGGRASYTPPAGIFSQGVLPPGFYSAGLWSNSGTGSGIAAAGRVASGRIGHLTWTVSVTLGGNGQCFVGAYRGRASASHGGGPTGGTARTTAFEGVGAAGTRQAVSGNGLSVECQPPQAPPGDGGISWLPIDALMNESITGFAGTVSAGTAYLVATGADGAVRRVTPTVIAGRKYFALVIPSGSRVARLTLYNAAGRVLATTTLFPATS